MFVITPIFIAIVILKNICWLTILILTEEGDQSVEMFLPNYASLGSQRQMKFNFDHPYRLVGILHTCIRYLSVKLKIDVKQSENYKNLIANKYEKGLFKENSLLFRSITHAINDIITRFIKKIEDNIQKCASKILKNIT